MNVVYYSLFLLFLLISVFMILLVLIQKGRGGGLSSAFGGGGGNTAFGAKTGDVLTWATSIVFGLFLVLAIVLNLLANRTNAEKSRLVAAPPAVEGVAPVTPVAEPMGVTPVAPPVVPSTPAPTTNP